MELLLLKIRRKHTAYYLEPERKIFQNIVMHMFILISMWITSYDGVRSINGKLWDISVPIVILPFPTC